MAKLYNGSSKLDWAMPFQRTGAFPLDRSSVFETLNDAKKYAKGLSTDLDSRGLGGSSYVGQIITVINSDGNGTPNVYFISDEDGTLSEVGTRKPDFMILDCGGALAKNEIANISIKNSDGSSITSLNLGIGGAYKIVINDENGNALPTSALTFTSSDPNVTVDGDGNITVVYKSGSSMNIDAVITVDTN